MKRASDDRRARADDAPSAGARSECEARASAGAGLLGGTPREVLARLVPDDPLHLRAIVAERLRERALLIDAERAHLRSCARCAHAAPRRSGNEALGEWLRARVDEAIDDLLEEERSGSAEIGGAFELLATPLGIDPGDAARGCGAFHRLSADDRRAFVELVLEGTALDALAARSEAGATELARRARRALDALLAGRSGASGGAPGGAAR